MKLKVVPCINQAGKPAFKIKKLYIFFWIDYSDAGNIWSYEAVSTATKIMNHLLGKEE
jgi:hypothetical protein